LPRFGSPHSAPSSPAAYHAERVVYLPPEARFDYLLNRPE